MAILEGSSGSRKEVSGYFMLIPGISTERVNALEDLPQ